MKFLIDYWRDAEKGLEKFASEDFTGTPIQALAKAKESARDRFDIDRDFQVLFTLYEAKPDGSFRFLADETFNEKDMKGK